MGGLKISRSGIRGKNAKARGGMCSPLPVYAGCWMRDAGYLIFRGGVWDMMKVPYGRKWDVLSPVSGMLYAGCGMQDAGYFDS